MGQTGRSAAHSKWVRFGCFRFFLKSYLAQMGSFPGKKFFHVDASRLFEEHTRHDKPFQTTRRTGVLHVLGGVFGDKSLFALRALSTKTLPLTALDLSVSGGSVHHAQTR